MIKKWMAVMVFGSTCLSGCVSAGLFSRGENASYSFWNNASEDIESVEIVGLYQDHKKYLISAARVMPARHNIRAFYGGYQYMSDTGHKVPEQVEVSWRKMPPVGGKPYTGELMGPYRVVVRSRIPEEALKLARRGDYSIGIEFSVGKEPVMLCWGVVTKEGGSLLGTIVSGGQCSPEDVAWRKDIDWRKPGVWFPEKN
ncbi:MAG: hypothetical protein AB1482_12615 [Pseudomonadota bacterium]|jgi:hypothetical protein